VTHAFPKLHALEQRYGSLILGQVLGARERKRRAEVSKQNAKKLSFDEGLDVLTQTLAARLGGSVRLNTTVTAVRQEAGGWRVSSHERGKGGPEEAAHSGVIYCGPVYRFSEIEWSSDTPIDPAPLSRVNHPPVASVVLGFRRADVAHPLDGFGMLVPEVEGLNILGTLFSSSLFPNRAPEGHVTLTTYVGGTRAPELALKKPSSLVEIVAKDLRTLLGVSGKATFEHCVLYPKAIPQYEVGYGQVKQLIDGFETGAPGLFMAGNYREGISLSDSILSGWKTAERVTQFLKREEPRQACNA
jgi:oxygen-dependent protoporphyrinogen oxidase